MSIDEVQALSRRRSDVVDNQVNAVGVSADSCIEGAGPDLGIGGKLEGSLRVVNVSTQFTRVQRQTYTGNIEGQVLEFSKLSGSYGEEARGGIQYSARRCLITSKGIYVSGQ